MEADAVRVVTSRVMFVTSRIMEGVRYGEARPV